jgi:hypothetical protein
MALLLAEDVGRLILVGNPDSSKENVRERLLAVAADAAKFAADRLAEGASLLPGTLAADLAASDPGEVIARLERAGRLVLSQDAAAAVRQAQVVVTATSATGTVLNGDDLRAGAVVCDVSRPANVSAAVSAARPDVLVLDGGVIAVPDGSVLSHFSLGEGLVFACMAETMLLTLAGRLENTSLGTDLQPGVLRQLRALADRHGFRVAKLRSFGRPLEDKDFQHLTAARR